jgi:hypothetical protein
MLASMASAHGGLSVSANMPLEQQASAMELLYQVATSAARH